MNRYWSDRFVNASIARAARGAEKDKEIDMGERQKAYPVAAAREITELEAELSALKWDHSRLQDRCTELVNENEAQRESKDKYITELSQQLTLASKNALNLARQHNEDETLREVMREKYYALHEVLQKVYDDSPDFHTVEWIKALLEQGD
jgi:molecular chaperone GrpE (heat shock protein)